MPVFGPQRAADTKPAVDMALLECAAAVAMHHDDQHARRRSAGSSGSAGRHEREAAATSVGHTAAGRQVGTALPARGRDRRDRDQESPEYPGGVQA